MAASYSTVRRPEQSLGENQSEFKIVKVECGKSEHNACWIPQHARVGTRKDMQGYERYEAC